MVFGEVALSGELRPVAHAGLRLRESAKLGFGRAILPALAAPETGMRLETHGRLGEVVDRLLGRG